jgi:iron-sulfur cluster assembly protein
MSDVMQYSSSSLPDITLSDAAKRRMLACLAEQVDCGAIRLSVKKTGCSGLSYVLDYVQTPEARDRTQALTPDYVICIDNGSYPYLKGLHIDYVKQGLNQKFVFENPNQTGQCGCGESFTVDDSL